MIVHYRPEDVLREQLLAAAWEEPQIARLRAVRERHLRVDLELTQEVLCLGFWRFIKRSGRLAPLGD